MIWSHLNWKRVAGTLAVATAVMLVLGAIIVWSGVYNIAASTDHLSGTTWLLQKMREQSIATQAASIEVRPVSDENMIRLGAAHFEGGCVPCHNRPGEEINPIVAGMLPSPPDLAETAPGRNARELFWIIKHGLKYTGMPAWPSIGRDDEIWALTAFLKSLPVSGSDYRKLAGLERLPKPADETFEQSGIALAQCSRCHDDKGLDTHGTHVPRLSGMPRDYLVRSLSEYADRVRPSGVMQPVADRLSAAGIDKLASHYSGLKAHRATPAGEYRNNQVRNGAILAERGAPDADLPACRSCHRAGGTGRFPPLEGQHAAYLESQLTLFKNGQRSRTALGRTMAAIAQRMTGEQIANSALYFSTIAPTNGKSLVSVGEAQ